MAILSKAQRKVIDAMADGYQLGQGRGFSSRCWLQHGGCGKGGITMDVNGQTFDFLVRNKMIEQDSLTHNRATYQLTDLGKSKVTPKKN